jgi:hypothetical protein
LFQLSHECFCTVPAAAYNSVVFKEASFDNRSDSPSPGSEDDPIESNLVREELHRIVTSRHFRTSKRGKEFLQYVVDQKISGNGDLLKERLIGVHVFGRNPDYATGEDPVVRVQAGDVRRRLESYHSDPEVQSDILIQIPLGSYAPVFLLKRSVQPDQVWQGSADTATDPKTETPGASSARPREVNETSALGPTHALANGSNASPTLELDDHPQEAASTSSRTLGVWRLAIPALACVALLVYFALSYINKSPEWTLKAFWLPASVATKPVLICLPRPIVYRPSEKLYDKYEAVHPNAFATREARRDQILPLSPTDPIQWGDMVPVRNSGPGIGAVVAAVNISKLLPEQGIRFELRFGEEATYADMRDSPVVIIGAINTDWATQLTSGSDFVFDETRGAPNIHETAGAKRVWKMESSDGNITRDYGLITRQLSGKAGQFLVQVAGISHFGTEAASEFLANEKDLTNVLHAKSINLQKKNFQIIVSTDITNGTAGPPQVVAVSSW